MELQILPTDFGRKFDIHLTDISGGEYLTAIAAESGEIRWVNIATYKGMVPPLLSLTGPQMQLLRRAISEKLGAVISNSIVSINLTDSQE